MVQANFMTTTPVVEIVWYPLLRSSSTDCYACLVPTWMTMCIRYRLLHSSGIDLYDYVHSVPSYAIVRVRYLFWIPRLGCWNEIFLDEFKAFFWFEHSLFIVVHNTFHHSYTSCHEDEIVSLKIGVSSNCNNYTNIWCYL